jgi:4-hydroxybenzoate polyprenyltransferase
MPPRADFRRWVLPWAQLLRIPNVFTALADIALGGLAAGTILTQPLGFVLLLAASACLYCGGMVWNDVFDIAEDRKARPFRPLPSGRASVASARWLGFSLLAAGLGLAALAGWRDSGFDWLPAELAGVLVAAIVGYDAWLKRTPLGPAGMGTCRFLNVLLGLSLADSVDFPMGLRLHLAGVVGLYIVGVTWFARREEGVSRRSHLRSAAVVMLAALAVALAVPLHRPSGDTSVLFPYLLVAFGFVVGLPVARAVREPTPATVQAAVKRSILGLIALDAVLATALVGWPGLLILVLAPPALSLGRWVYST